MDIYWVYELKKCCYKRILITLYYTCLTSAINTIMTQSLTSSLFRSLIKEERVCMRYVVLALLIVGMPIAMLTEILNMSNYYSSQNCKCICELIKWQLNMLGKYQHMQDKPLHLKTYSAEISTTLCGLLFSVNISSGVWICVKENEIK